MRVILPVNYIYKTETKPAHTEFEIDESDLPSLQEKGAWVIEAGEPAETPVVEPEVKTKGGADTTKKSNKQET